MAWGDNDPTAGQATAKAGWGDSDPVAQPTAAELTVTAPGKRTLTQDVTGFMAKVNRGLGIGDELAAGFRTAGDVVTGKAGLTEIPSDFRANMSRQRQIEGDYQSAHPHLSALATGTGNALLVAVPAGETASAYVNGGRAVNALRGAVNAGVTGAGYAAADAGTPTERLQAAERAVRDPATLALGAVLGAAAPAAKRAPKPASPEVALLANEGVQMTPGQMRGGLAKATEDAATSVPILGTAINDARNRGVESFNRAVANRALKPIGEQLPAEVPMGNEAVKYVGDKLGEGYKALVPDAGVRADPGFAQDVAELTDRIGTLTPDSHARVNDIVEQRLGSRLSADGRLQGPLYKQVQSELGYDAARFKASGDADQQAIGDVLEGISGALEDAAARQNPRFAAQLSRLDKGWAQLVRMEKAAGSSAADGGIFTPTQFNQATVSAEGKIAGRSRRIARGEGLNQDLATAGKRVLPSKLGNSGTADRAMIGTLMGAPGAVMGATAAGGPVAGLAAAGGIGATLGGAKLASRIYSPEAMSAANDALRARLAGGAASAAPGAVGNALVRHGPRAAAALANALRASIR